MEGVRANSAAMNTQAMDDYGSTFTEDVLWEDDALPAPVVGRDAAVQTMSSFYTAFPDLHFEVEREFASGDQAAVSWRVTGTHRGDFGGIPPTGRRIDYHSSAIFEMRDGKIDYVRTYIPTGYILEQLGVSLGSDQAAGAVAAST